MNDYNVGTTAEHVMHQPEPRGAVHLQRLVSVVMCLLGAVECSMSQHWTCWLSVAAFLASLVATWMPARVQNASWAICFSIGLLLSPLRDSPDRADRPTRSVRGSAASNWSTWAGR